MRQHHPAVVRVIRSFAVMAACIHLVTSTSLAQSLLIQNAERWVFALGEDVCPGCGPMGEDTFFSDGDSIRNTSDGFFDVSVRSVGSDASQTSTVRSKGIFGSGAIAGGFSSSSDAGSEMLVDFTVSKTGTYNLSGSVRSRISNFGLLSDQAYVALSDSNGDLFRQESFDFVESIFDENLLLQSGVMYTLDARVSSFFGVGDDGGGSWTVNLSVPEPASVTLIFSAAVLALAGRWRRSHAAWRTL